MVTIQNLYAIRYTSAGPIAKLVVTMERALLNPEKYKEIALEQELFNYQHAKEIIVSWFIERAAYIDELPESEYIGGKPSEELWQKFCKDKHEDLSIYDHNAKDREESFLRGD